MDYCCDSKKSLITQAHGHVARKDGGCSNAGNEATLTDIGSKGQILKTSKV